MRKLVKRNNLNKEERCFMENLYRQTFGDYLIQKGKECAEGLFYSWMCLFAPTGAIILGILAFSGTFSGCIKMYLTFGFGFCLLCTLITAFLVIYENYEENQRER